MQFLSKNFSMAVTLSVRSSRLLCCKIFVLKYFRRTSTLRKFFNTKIFPTKISYNENFPIYGIRSTKSPQNPHIFSMAHHQSFNPALVRYVFMQVGHWSEYVNYLTLQDVGGVQINRGFIKRKTDMQVRRPTGNFVQVLTYLPSGSCHIAQQLCSSKQP